VALQRAQGTRGLALLAAVVAVAYLLVISVATGSRLAVVVDDLGTLAAPLVAAVACALAARRTQDRLRRSWALLAGFAGVWALGQAAWCWYEVVQHVPTPFPGLPDLGYLASVPLVLAALLVHPDAPRLTSGRLRLAADALLVGTSLLALAWRLVLREAYLQAGAHGLGRVLGLAYPALDVVVLTALVLVGTRTRGRPTRPLVLVAVCLCMGAAGHLVYGVLVQNGSWQSGTPVDAAWGIGFLFLALGAVTETGAARLPLPDRVGGTRSALLPYLPLAGLTVVVVLDQVHGRVVDATGRVVAGVLFAALLARQLLALVENGRLNRHLEATVQERTSALQRTTEELRRQAWTDPLTGLPNRTGLFDVVEAAITEGPVLVGLLDLDGFKSVNDSLGHAAGDELLARVGELLSHGLPAGAVVGRLGGDEFAFVLPGCGSEPQALRFGDAVLALLGRPVGTRARSVVVTGSLGLALAEPGDTPESLLRNADLAMYAAKDAGKARVRLFEQAMRDQLLARVTLERELRLALLAGEVVPWYQPVIDLESGRITGVEALARWRRGGDLGSEMVPPGVFVPLAEQCGLVSLLGRQVLRTACAQAAVWNQVAPMSLSVNLSAVQLAGEDLVDMVREALADSGLPPSQLVLEITETALVEDLVSVGPRLAALRVLGIRIALDDFGTGYSPLGNLQQIPVDVVKIDRAFVREVHLGPRQSALASAVMTLAASLGLSVVAEGIEIPEQATRLRELGCTLAQGFLWFEALPPERFLLAWDRQALETVEKSA
jgi:diguanylate cyclase (GGDEF)-like protein